MKYYGDIDLNQNQLMNAVVSTSTGFPTVPVVGQLVFMNKKLYICTEIQSGLPAWVPMTQEIDSFVFQQASAETAWTIVHNLNTAAAFVQVYDTNGLMLIPDYVDTSVFNQVTVMFSAAQAGTAVIMMGSLSGAPKDIIAFTASFTNSDTWVVNHNLGYYPEINVYVGGELVQPLSIVNNSTTQATITFSAAETGTVRCV